MAWLFLGSVPQALVAIDTLAHGVLSDLLSATGNNMDITFLAQAASSDVKSAGRSFGAQHDF